LRGAVGIFIGNGGVQHFIDRTGLICFGRFFSGVACVGKKIDRKTVPLTVVIAFLTFSCVNAADFVEKVDPQADSLWEKSIELFSTGKIREALSSLNLALAAGSGSEKNRVSDVARLAGKTFVPTLPGKKEMVTWLSDSLSMYGSVFMEDEELQPVEERWTIASRESRKDSLPVFSYAFTFAFDDQPRFDPPSLLTLPKLSIDSVIENAFKKYPKSRELHVFPGKFSARADFRILVDCRKAQQPLDEYLWSIVYGKYDAVKPMRDLKRLGALSVRCYTNSIYRDLPGQFSAFIVFDVTFGPSPSGKSATRNGKTIISDEWFTARYLISARSSRSVEEKTERLLAAIVKRFDGN
jgi:hypothetical protein